MITKNPSSWRRMGQNDLDTSPMSVRYTLNPSAIQV